MGKYNFKNVLNNGLKILLYLLGAMPFISCIVACYWLYHFAEKDAALRKHRILTYLIYMSGFITLLAVLIVGTRRLLFFIPWSWGSHDEDTGEWMSAREIISIFIALCAVNFVANLFARHEWIKRKLAAMKITEQQLRDVKEEDVNA